MVQHTWKHVDIQHQQHEQLHTRKNQTPQKNKTHQQNTHGNNNNMGANTHDTHHQHRQNQSTQQTHRIRPTHNRHDHDDDRTIQERRSAVPLGPTALPNGRVSFDPRRTYTYTYTTPRSSAHNKPRKPASNTGPTRLNSRTKPPAVKDTRCR